jgi:hypothetical protein
LALYQLAGAPTFFDAHHEAKQFASLALSLLNLTRLWAFFAKGFNQSLNVNVFPERLFTNCMLLGVMSAAQWNYSPIIWLLSHPCTTTIANMSAFDWHIFATFYAAMK